MEPKTGGHEVLFLCRFRYDDLFILFSAAQHIQSTYINSNSRNNRTYVVVVAAAATILHTVTYIVLLSIRVICRSEQIFPRMTDVVSAASHFVV